MNIRSIRSYILKFLLSLGWTLGVLVPLQAQKPVPVLQEESGFQLRMHFGMSEVAYEKRADQQFLHYHKADSTILYSDRWDYIAIQHMPCGEEHVHFGQEMFADVRGEAREFCTMPLYAHRENGCVALKKLAVHPYMLPTRCEDSTFVISLTHKPLDVVPLYISTVKGSEKPTYVASDRLRALAWPTWWPETSMRRLDSLHPKAAYTLFKLEGDCKDCYLVEALDSVSNNGIFARPELHMPALLRWDRMYFLRPGIAQQVVPNNPNARYALGLKCEFLGMEDMNGDGNLDLLFGQRSPAWQVDWIWERAGDGYRTFGFPSMSLVGECY